MLAAVIGWLSVSKRTAPTPASALEVALVAHQYWWEIRYPQMGIVTANELHVPIGAGTKADATRLSVTSADIDHSLLLPDFSVKLDAKPNDVSTAWLRPQKTGLYVGGCGVNCGQQSGGMRLRVYVDSTVDFRDWAQRQRLPAVNDPKTQQGKAIFEQSACASCHMIAGTVAGGRFGPDLTHVASRETIAAGLLPNTRENLRAFVDNPAQEKPGCLMPAMHLSPADLDAVTAYLATLK